VVRTEGLPVDGARIPGLTDVQSVNGLLFVAIPLRDTPPQSHRHLKSHVSDRQYRKMNYTDGEK
jgi:hypothetical protein